MSEKKTNEILEQQRKARQDIIDLKKMQSGEMYAGPKPSETATVLKTPKEKFKNFWHYSKWYVIGTVAVTVLIIFMVAQCVMKPAYDLKVVYFTYKPVLDEITEPIADYLEQYCEDVNGDGQVNIQIINCSVSNDASNYTSRNTVLQKIQSILVAEESAMLFITDEESVAYFNAMTDDQDGFFYDTVALGEDFYEATKTDGSFGELTEGLSISCRKIDGTVIEEEETVGDCFEAAKTILSKIRETQTDD